MSHRVLLPLRFRFHKIRQALLLAGEVGRSKKFKLKPTQKFISRYYILEFAFCCWMRLDSLHFFQDEKATNENRYLAITGQPEDVKLAEIMIYQTMANQPFQETFEMNVPSIYVGAIIGRNGDTVRSIEDRSGCRINVQRLPPAEVTDRRVTFRGSPSQIQSARSLIEDAINEERQFQDG